MRILMVNCGSNLYDKLCDRVSELFDKQHVEYELIKIMHTELAPFVENELEDVHTLVLSGSKYNSPNLPEMADVAKLVQLAYEKKIPAFGVCYGFQLMSFLFDTENGMVKAGGVSHENAQINIVAEDPILEGIPATFLARQYHSFSVPYQDANLGAATVLAYSHTGVEIIRAGSLVATQFHPESKLTSPEAVKVLENFVKYAASLN